MVSLLCPEFRRIREETKGIVREKSRELVMKMTDATSSLRVDVKSKRKKSHFQTGIWSVC